MRNTFLSMRRPCGLGAYLNSLEAGVLERVLKCTILCFKRANIAEIIA